MFSIFWKKVRVVEERQKEGCGEAGSSQALRINNEETGTIQYHEKL